MSNKQTVFADCMPDQSLDGTSATPVKCEVLAVRAINSQIKTVLPEAGRTLLLENTVTRWFSFIPL